MNFLISSTPKNKTFQHALKYQFGRIAKSFLGAVDPLDQAKLLKEYNLDAHVFTKQFASTHYGVMIPDLPEPYRYLSHASVIGDIGAKVTHTPKSISGLAPDNIATFVHSTACSDPAEAYRIYNIKEEIKFSRDPFRIDYSQDSSLVEEDGRFHLTSALGDLEVDLWLTPTPAMTWFAYSIFYQHFSVMMQYQGHIKQKGKRIEVSGLCTLEHWKAVASSMLPHPIKPASAIVPLDTFSYQVINLDEDSQLVLAYIGFAGQPAYTAVSYRHVDGTSIQYENAHFQVVALKTDSLMTPDGHVMEVPQSFRWIVHHGNEKVLDILGVVDTPYCFGLAAGYVSSYQWSGVWKGQESKGRGYLEYIDRRTL